jgi:hypothetical protein
MGWVFRGEGSREAGADVADDAEELSHRDPEVGVEG